MTTKPLIAVAMSGGVDSSVAASLICEAGHPLFGITMETTEPNGEAQGQARIVAEHLGIDHYVIDMRERFDELVLRRCWQEYTEGLTPNPCVICNRHIKFGLLFEAAQARGATALATGHYARLKSGPSGRGFVVQRGKDCEKDQSYFLARLSQKQLARTRFPLGNLTKSEVRLKAERLELPSADSKESQDTCLTLLSESGREGAFAETLRKRFAETSRPGELVDLSGNVLGKHEGVHRFTIGQRRGLRVSLGKRAFVAAIDAQKQQVLLTTDPKDLLTSKLLARRFHWQHPGPLPTVPFDCQIQIRYRHRPVPAKVIESDGDTLIVELPRPIAAVTPGQAAVLYDDDEVIGCGWIGC